MNFDEWLVTVCKMLPGTTVGALFFCGSDKPELDSFWQAEGRGGTPVKLAELATLATRRNSTLVNFGESPEDGKPFCEAGLSFYSINRSRYVVTVHLDMPQVDPQKVIRILEWGVAWFHVLERATPSNPQQMLIPQSFIATIRNGTEVFYRDLLIAIQGKFNCQFAAISFRKESTDLHDLILQAPLEKKDLEYLKSVLDYSADYLDIPALCNTEQPELASLCFSTFPFHGASEGKLVLAWKETDKLQIDDSLLQDYLQQIELCRSLQLEELKSTVTVTQKAQSGSCINGSRKRFVWSIAVILTMLAMLIPLDYVVKSPARVEGRIQRAISVPFDGYLSSIVVGTGQVLEAGELIATLDDAELKLQLNQAMHERASLEKQYRLALSQLDFAASKRFTAQRDKAQIEIELVQTMLSKVELRAPIDGVIISGDISRAAGAAVEKGQVLFEMAPAADYRVVIDVDERDIRYINVDQPGSLVLSGLAGETLPLTVDAVSAVYSQEEGGRHYRCEARFDLGSQLLRPGMQGTAGITVGQRRLGWLLLHRAYDWLQLKIWQWLP